MEDELKDFIDDLWNEFADESDGCQTTMNYESFTKVIYRLLFENK